MASLQSLRIERSGPIAEVVLIGPGKGNALGPDFWREAPQVFADLGRDPETRVIILRGEGSHFSYGLDLAAMAPVLGPVLQAGAAERTQLLAMIGDLQRSVQAIAGCPKPVIAAVSGWCIGGGLDLIAACDVRLCSQTARFSLREVKVAMVADLGSLQRLPRLIGEGHTRELALTGKNIDAARAVRIGLVNESFESDAAVLTAARAMAQEIVENPPLVVAGIKAILEDGVGPSVTEGLRRVALWNSAFLPSEDLTEALTAFMERRPPKFQGK